MNDIVILVVILFIIIIYYFNLNQKKEPFSQKIQFDKNSHLYIINLARKRSRCIKLLELLKIPLFITILNARDGEELTEKDIQNLEKHQI